MIETPKCVIVDMCVDPSENCFPMVPGGHAHNEMLLADEVEASKAEVSEEGKILV